MIRRELEKILSISRGKQLLWLTLLMIVVLAVLFCINWLFIGMNWQDIVPTFLGVGGTGQHQLFRLVTGLLGRFLFSALLVTAFVKVYDNVSNAYRFGESKYAYSNHILIIGAGRPLRGILSALRNRPDFADKEILIMTSDNVDNLRIYMQTQLADRAFCNRVNYFHRVRHAANYLKDAYADQASLIYIIGEKGETAHDALNIRCLSLLKELCGTEGPVIPCYLFMEMHTTLSVFNYLKDNNTSRLNVEVINDSDYVVEQLLVNTTFLPAFKPSDTHRSLHLVIAGDSCVARSFASVAAQLCHYPNFKGSDNRTKISLIGYSKEERDKFVANNSSLFRLCHYSFVSADQVESFSPSAEYGDFMDIEWEFIDDNLISPFVRSKIVSWVADPSETTEFALCFDNDEHNAYLALHLPHETYDAGCAIAVFQNGYSELISSAIDTNMFGNIFIFGEANTEEDLLFMKRSLMGKRVNRVYDLAYGNPPAQDEEEAWKKLPYAHKYSSIASANSIALKLRCFDIDANSEASLHLSKADLDSLSEVEHRRWMITQLFMGYRAATIKEREDRTRFKELKNEKFIHLDIAPYEELLGEEEKDMLIINNISYILTGKQKL